MIFNYFESERKLLYYQHDADVIPEEIIAEYRDKDVKCVDFSANFLDSFECITQFSNLNEVILDNNYFSDNTIFPKNSLPTINLLSLNNNKFETLDKLIDNLTQTFPSINYLSLLGNPLCPALHQDYSDETYKSYRMDIITRMPKLKFLDATMVDKYELSQLNINAMQIDGRNNGSQQMTVATTSGRMNKFGKIKKFFGFILSDSPPERISMTPPPESFSPLPVDEAEEVPKERTAYGKLRYNYDGSNSQGNRFIANEDL